MDISCAFAPEPDTVEHIALAERLGYVRAWIYDSPALYLDLWATLVEAANRTERIGLGSGVTVARLRNVTVTASALLTAHIRAPGRITLGIGAGGSSTMMLGKKSTPWSETIAYVGAVRALLRGERVEWDGSVIQLMPAWDESPLPVEIPVVIGAEGPRGEQAARDHADGVFSAQRIPDTRFEWSCRLLWGTVLDEGEHSDSDRAFAASVAGAALTYHFAYQTGNRAFLSTLPSGDAVAGYLDGLPDIDRHLSLWEGHLLRASAMDRKLMPRGAPATITCTGSPAAVRDHIRRLAEQGITEVV